jgi:hypothetical protein
VAADPDRLLRIYLNEAGSALGLAVTRRMARRNRGSDLGQFLEGLVREIEEDRESLLQVMRALGVPRNRAKEGAARAFERVGLLKLNGQIRGYSDLSRVLELEFLRAGVDAKRALWVSLRDTGRSVPVDLARLIERAERQRDEIEPHRVEAARHAFGASRF